MYETTEIERHLTLRFSWFPEVNSMYILKFPQVIEVLVFLDQEQYDDGLMDQLLDQEIIILERFPDQLFDFRYLPLQHGKYFINPVFAQVF
jgi:hypothetical protein